MMKIKTWLMLAVIASISFILTGCQSTGKKSRNVSFHSKHFAEPKWIQNGEPIEFENELWYPADSVEGFLDSEMRLMGEYRGTQFFVDKVDVRPYGRLYTKFARNKFRFFEKRLNE